MELFKCLFGVVVIVVCDVTADQWKSQQQPAIPVPHTPYERCQVEEGEKIRCGTTDTTAEHCETINCCFDGLLCYYGKAVTVQCTKDGQFVVVVSRFATLPHIDVDSISLLDMTDASCSPVGVTVTFVIFQFPVTACGSKMKEENGDVVYENHMMSKYYVGNGPRGAITRDSSFELLFQCRYTGTAVQALIFEVNTVPPPKSVAVLGSLRVELRLANGRCHIKGCMEDEAAYSSYYMRADYPVTKVLREPVYVEVHILERTDPNLILNLEHCWATSKPDPNDLPQWDILVDGCPYRDDRYQTRVIPVHGSSELLYPTHYKRFVIKMFAFVCPKTHAPMKDTVFIHCATVVCYPSSTNSCEQSCYRQRRAALKKKSSGQTVLVSSEEVIMSAPRPFPAENKINETTSAPNKTKPKR